MGSMSGCGDGGGVGVGLLLGSLGLRERCVGCGLLGGPLVITCALLLCLFRSFLSGFVD